MPYMCVSTLFQVHLGCKLFSSLVEALKGLKAQDTLQSKEILFSDTC